MTILISCSAPAFVAQKGRKLLIPAPILLSGLAGAPPFFLRVTLTDNPFGVCQIQAIPGIWDGTATSVRSTQVIDPGVSVPALSAFPSFEDDSGLASGFTGYSATYLVEAIDSIRNVQIGFTNLVLSGRANPAQSANVVFVLDRANSMSSTGGSPPRLDRLKAAFPRGVALLREWDTLGVATFANYRCAFNPQLPAAAATVGPSGQQDQANQLALSLNVDTVSPLQKAIQIGVDAGHALNPSATIVLLTDGVNQNSGNHPLNLTSPTFGLIIGENPATMPPSTPITTAAIAASGGNSLFAAPGALGEFAIEKLLTQILIGLVGSAFVSDPEGSLGPGGSQTFPLYITEADRELEVIVFSNDAAALEVSVVDLKVGEHPFNSADYSYDRSPDPCQTGPRRLERPEVVRGEGFLVMRLPMPDLPHPDRAYHPKVIVSRAAAASCDAPPPPVRFNLLLVAKTALVLDAQATTSGPLVGSDLLFSAVLSEYGPAWHRSNVSVHVELSHPDGGIQMIQLHECAPGRFQASLRSFRSGAYTAHFIATGRSLLHHRPFRRECLRTVVVLPPSACSTPEDPCAC